MDWLTFFSNVVGAVLSWPVAIIVVIWILREPLKEVIRSLENLAIEAGGVRFDMNKRLNEAKQEAEEADVPALGERVVTDDDARFAEKEYGWLYKLAETYPRSAVMEAWVQVETEARALIEMIEPQPSYVSRGKDSRVAARSRRGLAPDIETVAQSIRTLL